MRPVPARNPQASAAPRKQGANATPAARAKAKAQVRASPFTNDAAGAALISPDKPLTDKQKMFVKHWAQGESVFTASARAGYGDGGSFCYRLSKMPNVLRAYNAEKRKYEEASQMTRKKVMDGLLEAVEMAKLMAEPASMISGWREIAKMCGYMAPIEKKIDINVTGHATFQRLERLSDAELLKLIQAPIEEALLEEDDDEN